MGGKWPSILLSAASTWDAITTSMAAFRVQRKLDCLNELFPHIKHGHNSREKPDNHQKRVLFAPPSCSTRGEEACWWTCQPRSFLLHMKKKTWCNGLSRQSRKPRKAYRCLCSRIGIIIDGKQRPARLN